jgi:hypothetical protein
MPMVMGGVKLKGISERAFTNRRSIVLRRGIIEILICGNKKVRIGYVLSEKTRLINCPPTPVKFRFAYNGIILKTILDNLHKTGFREKGKKTFGVLDS